MWTYVVLALAALANMVGSVHQVAGPLERHPLPVRFIAQKGFDPFPMDVGRPLDFEEIRDSQLYQRVAHRCGIERTFASNRSVYWLISSDSPFLALVLRPPAHRGRLRDRCR